MLLVIGNKNYSSWSLRPWIAMKVFGSDFHEKRIPLYGERSKEAILQHSPAGKVPILVDGKATVWDSLAILEYLAERNRKLWPADAAERARARARPAESATRGRGAGAPPPAAPGGRGRARPGALARGRDALRVREPAQPHEHERA